MQYDFNLLANGAQVLEVAGKFFKYKSGAGAIRVKASKGGFVDLMPGQGVFGVDFTTLIVSDKSGVANSGIILAGDYDFHDDTISGTVNVVDGGMARTLAGGANTMTLYANAVAAVYSGVQLWNPPGSGKNIIVEQFTGVISGGFTLLMNLQNSIVTGAGALVNGGNKKSGGALPVGVGYSTQSSGALLPTTVQTYGVPNGILIKLAEPIVITPGYGLLFAPGVVNQTAGVNIEFFEQSI